MGGSTFIVFRTHALQGYNLLEAPAEPLTQMQERRIVKFGESFVLHPNMLTLGATFEYVHMPVDLECQIEGRSSWARLGLQIATANSVEPGFKGVLTLELTNVGTIPLTLWPGVRIAQLVFRRAEPPLEPVDAGTARKYRCPVGPEFSKLDTDRDIGFIRALEARVHSVTHSRSS